MGDLIRLDKKVVIPEDFIERRLFGEVGSVYIEHGWGPEVRIVKPLLKGDRFFLVKGKGFRTNCVQYALIPLISDGPKTESKCWMAVKDGVPDIFGKFAHGTLMEVLEQLELEHWAADGHVALSLGSSYYLQASGEFTKRFNSSYEVKPGLVKSGDIISGRYDGELAKNLEPLKWLDVCVDYLEEREDAYMRSIMD